MCPSCQHWFVNESICVCIRYEKSDEVTRGGPKDVGFTAKNKHTGEMFVSTQRGQRHYAFTLSDWSLVCACLFDNILKKHIVVATYQWLSAWHDQIRANALFVDNNSEIIIDKLLLIK